MAFRPTTASADPVKSAFARHDRIVFTYLFPWYLWDANPALREHITHPAGYDYLSVHPAPQTRWYDRNPDYRKRRAPDVSGAPLLSYRNATWFASELAVMESNAVDVCAVDFWAFPDPNTPPRSRQATECLNAAMDSMDRAGTRYPAVCLFLESKPLGNGPGGGDQVTDLRTEDGARRLYAAVRDFFSRVSRRRWAQIDGKALVILYDSTFQGLTPAPYGIRRCKELFRQEFQTGLAFFGNGGWRAMAGQEIDYLCHWGAARHASRLVETTDLMEIAPGNNFLGNTHGVPRDPAGYQRAWEAARAQREKNWIAIETWNEWHEGTGVGNTVEDGDRFLRVTQSQARRFKRRE